MSLSLEKWHRQHPNSTPFYWSPQAKPALPGSHMPMTESLSAIIWSPKKRMIIKFKKKNDLYQPHRRHWLLSPKKRMIEWWTIINPIERSVFFKNRGFFSTLPLFLWPGPFIEPSAGVASKNNQFFEHVSFCLTPKTIFGKSLNCLHSMGIVVFSRQTLYRCRP